MRTRILLVSLLIGLSVLLVASVPERLVELTDGITTAFRPKRIVVTGATVSDEGVVAGLDQATITIDVPTLDPETLVELTDGTTAVDRPGRVVVTGGTVTDDGLVSGLSQATVTVTAGTGTLNEIREADGSPVSTVVQRIVVPNTTLVNDSLVSGKRQVTLNYGTVDEIKELDGSPLVNYPRRLVFPNNSITDDGVISGKRQLSIAPRPQVVYDGSWNHDAVVTPGFASTCYRITDVATGQILFIVTSVDPSGEARCYVPSGGIRPIKFRLTLQETTGLLTNCAYTIIFGAVHATALEDGTEITSSEILVGQAAPTASCNTRNGSGPIDQGGEFCERSSAALQSTVITTWWTFKVDDGALASCVGQSQNVHLLMVAELVGP